MAERSPTVRDRRSTLQALVAALMCSVLVTACLPDRPAAGRSTPVRRVVVIGDSITHGLFGTTPRISGEFDAQMGKLGLSVGILGYPGDSIFAPWPGRTDWVTAIGQEVETNDPDVIIIQSINFPESLIPGSQALYLLQTNRLFDAAQRRGAHVYIVRHRLIGPPRIGEFELAQRLQSQAAEGRGIETIPLDWWVDRCVDPLIGDGVHLTEGGSVCLADAFGSAVRQLRNEVG